MDDDDMQQFSLRWHNHQNSIIGALSRMLSTGTLTDVTLSASGTTLKAHRIVLASCSQYFAQLFKDLETENNTVVVVLGCGAAELRLLLTFMYTGEVTASKSILPSLLILTCTFRKQDLETENNTLVVVLGCEAAELRLLLTFMYTGEVTASKSSLPSLLRLAQSLKVSGLTDADTNSTLTPTEPDPNPEHEVSPINLEHKSDAIFENSDSNSKHDDDSKEPDFMRERDRLSKLDQIVQNLYSTHKIGNPTTAITPPVSSLEPPDYERKWRVNTSVCTICNKRLSNQYNLRVHMETHAGRRHACRACSHVSRSRDALRKHVAYRHAPAHHATDA